MIPRRTFVAGLGAAAAWPLASRAQQAGLPVIGVLYGVSAAAWADRMDAVRRGLAETGFVDGRNVSIDYRWAEGHLDQMGWLAAGLIARRPAVILIGGDTASVRSLLSATQTIPVVFTTGANPVEDGLVASLSHPGGNATGVTVVGAELGAKRLALLHEVVPAARKIAVLVNENNKVSSEDDIRTAQATSPGLGLEMIVVNGGTESEFESAFMTAAQQGAGAVFIGTDAVLFSRGEQIAALSLRYKLPTISSQRGNTRSGQLLSYGTNDLNMYRQAGVYVGRILKGEKPGDLPVVQPTKFELVINLKTAKALGLTVPPSVLAFADEVIE
jgi:putative tryptophan/tyrosine transport system substrate-binding protein